MRPPIRFSIRLLLVLVAVTAIATTTAQKIHYWQTWAPYRQQLNGWAANLKREPNRGESLEVTLPNGRRVGVSTAELRIEDGGRVCVYSGQPIQPEGYFLFPQGTWVDSVPEIIHAWQDTR